MNRVLPHPLLSLIVFALWLLLNNSIAPGQIVLAVIIALILPRVTTGFWTMKAHVASPAALLGYIGIVVYDIIAANFTVARQVLGRNAALRPAFFRVPLDLDNPLAISVLANTITLTPGTVSCQVDENRHQLLVHALHTDDPDGEIAAIKQRYEARLKRIFVSPSPREHGHDRTGGRT